MIEQSALLWAYHIDTQLHPLEPPYNTPKNDFDWIHFRSDTLDSIQTMQSVGVPEAMIEVLCAAETRPRCLKLHEGSVLILRGINRNSDAAPEDMASLRVWITENRLISAHKMGRGLVSIQDVKEAMGQGDLPDTPYALLSRLLTRMVDHISEAVVQIDERLEALEQQTQRPLEANALLAQIRRQAAAIRRYLSPQRDALDQFYRLHRHLPEELIFELKEQGDRMTRYLEDLDLLSERALVQQDELQNQIANAQGQRMYLLSMITAVFLPLSFLTGVFGMNVAGLPGTQDANAFFYLSSFMVGLAFIVVVVMLLKRWL